MKNYSLIKFKDGKYGAKNNETGYFLSMGGFRDSDGVSYEFEVCGLCKCRFRWWAKRRIKEAIKRREQVNFEYTVIEEDE